MINRNTDGAFRKTRCRISLKRPKLCLRQINTNNDISIRKIINAALYLRREPSQPVQPCFPDVKLNFTLIALAFTCQAVYPPSPPVGFDDPAQLPVGSVIRAGIHWKRLKL